MIIKAFLAGVVVASALLFPSVLTKPADCRIYTVTYTYPVPLNNGAYP